MEPQDKKPEPEEPTASEFPAFAFGPGAPMPSVEDRQRANDEGPAR